MRKAIVPAMLIAVLAAIVIVSGCNVTGSGKVIEEEKDFTDFSRVDVGSAFEVEIVKANSFSVKISADESLIDYVVVSKEADTLKINLKPHHIFTDFTLGKKTLKAEITMPALRGLEVSGATETTISGFAASENFILEVSGASSLKMDDIEVGNADFDVSGASDVTGSMKATNVVFKVSGASTVKLTGSASNLVLDTSGASNADLTEFPLAEDADVKLSGASKATVNLKGTLDCNVSAASSLFFLGNPTMGDVEVSGASTIKHK